MPTSSVCIIIADEKLLDLGLLDSSEAYKAQYYGYMMNGLLTQQVRIKPGKNIEEAHMQNRALIAWWAMDLGSKDHVVELIKQKMLKVARLRLSYASMTMRNCVRSLHRSG